MAHYATVLVQCSVPPSQHAYYRKWLRYYLDFCATHDLPDFRQERVRLFINKLQEKKQTPAQQKQAAHAVALYFALLRAQEKVPEIIGAGGLPRQRERMQPQAPLPARGGTSADSLRGKVAPVVPAEWETIAQRLADAIKTRPYSPKTLKAYALWTTKFRYFTGDKTPESLSSADVKAYLTHLAVKCKVFASTQNQAFTALLFLFRHVLKKDFGDHRDIPRARRTRYIPVVLSRQEIDAVLKHLSPPSDLVVTLLYGCGLRLCEGLKLRLHHCNCAAGILTLHDGQGRQDRPVPSPQLILPALQAQLERVMKLHDQDSAAGYAGVFLDGLLEKKYPAAPRELVWQGFLPANYDIRTIPALLGHSEVRTTMIYTHALQSRTVKEAKSPLDF